MVAGHSAVLALVGVLFMQCLPETGREGRESCSEVWHGLPVKGEYAGTLQFERETKYRGMQNPEQCGKWKLIMFLIV